MERIDKLLVSNEYFPTREKAQVAIKSGRVFVDGKRAECSTKVSENCKIEVNQSDSYVSRGAYKLLGAKQKFDLDFSGKVVLDIGSSTGGFTQVALEGGAKKVYALDVGTNQLAESLKSDDRVVNMEQTDFRTAEKLDDVNMIVSDISFISLRHIIPKIVEEYRGVEAVILFKPQFECGVIEAKRHNGVVRDKRLHLKLLQDFDQYLRFFKFKISNFAYSSITWVSPLKTCEWQKPKNFNIKFA